MFGIEIDRCGRCAGKLKILASTEEPEVIAKILAHLEKTPNWRFPGGRQSAQSRHKTHSVK